MKKIVLKKEVIARISDNEMSHLKGGTAGSDNACTTPYCPTKPTLTPTPTPTPEGAETCGSKPTCNG
jgi:natural product precursor